MGYLLDTDTIIFLLKGKFKLNRKVKSVGLENCYVSIISIAELLFGAENSEAPLIEKRKGEVAAVQRQFQVVSLEKALAVYGKEKARLRKEGNRIEDNDLFIGATAIANGLVLVTGNTKHFQRLEGIQLEDWSMSEHNEFV